MRAQSLDGVRMQRRGQGGEVMEGYCRRAKQLRALAHPVRLQLVEVLCHQPACVCELVTLTHQRQPYISQQLSVLRQAGLVKWEKLGLLVRYQLADSEVRQRIDDLRAMIADPALDEHMKPPDDGLVPQPQPLEPQPLEEIAGLLAQGDIRRP